MTAPVDPRPLDDRDDAKSFDGTGSAEPREDGAGFGPAADGPDPRVAALEDRLRRMQADFVNETQRIRRQSDDRGRYAIEQLLSDLLPVFDALHAAREGFQERALHASGAAAPTATAALEGFDLVEKELLNVLSRHGVARIDAAEGAPFDPSRHHAIVMVDRADLDAHTIARELRPGFTLHDRVVRPAHVAVAAERESGARTSAADPDREDGAADRESEEDL